MSVFYAQMSVACVKQFVCILEKRMAGWCAIEERMASKHRNRVVHKRAVVCGG